MQLAIKQLAVAVIRQAFWDLERHSLRASAMEFINSRDFEFWTSILNINADMLREKARTIPPKQRKKIS
jgi:hypothetical protein